MFKVQKATRRPFDVDFVEVTEDNMEAVAEWCGGDVRTDKNKAKYVKVRVVRPLTPRQSEAYANDVVLYAGTGYKVYTPRAFEAAFERISSETSLHTSDDELVAVQEQEHPLDTPAEPLAPYEGNVLDPFPQGQKTG